MAFLAFAASVLLLAFQASAATTLLGQVTSPVANSGVFQLKLGVGTPSQTQLLRLDLNAHAISLPCSTSFHPHASSTFRPSSSGKPASDRLTLNTTTGSSPGKPFSVNHVALVCTASSSGVASVSSSPLALPAQLAAQARLARQFAYCLPSSTNNPAPIFFGSGVDYIFQSGPPVNVSAATLSSADLLINAKTQTYALGLQGITVDGTSVSIKSQELQISTTQPYTKLDSATYKPLLSAFVAKAAARNLTRVAAAAPFQACYAAASASSTRLGAGVPEIDLKLQGNATWQIFGLNSVVSVSDSVLCLAFLDAGAGQPSVLGTFQQEDNLLEFDLAKSRLRFSGPLDFFRTVCVDFLF